MWRTVSSDLCACIRRDRHTHTFCSWVPVRDVLREHFRGRDTSAERECGDDIRRQRVDCKCLNNIVFLLVCSEALAAENSWSVSNVATSESFSSSFLPFPCDQSALTRSMTSGVWSGFLQPTKRGFHAFRWSMNCTAVTPDSNNNGGECFFRCFVTQ